MFGTRLSEKSSRGRVRPWRNRLLENRLHADVRPCTSQTVADSIFDLGCVRVVGIMMNKIVCVEDIIAFYETSVHNQIPPDSICEKIIFQIMYI